jgi:hypothetical protein
MREPLADLLQAEVHVRHATSAVSMRRVHVAHR